MKIQDINDQEDPSTLTTEETKCPRTGPTNSNPRAKVPHQMTTSWLKKPSNKKIIINSISNVCLAGVPNKKKRDEILL